MFFLRTRQFYSMCLKSESLENAYLNAFLVQCVLIKVEDGGLNGAGRR